MDGDAPEPIEVELTSHEPRSGRAGRRRREPPPVEPPGADRADRADADADGPDADAHGATPAAGTERTRLVVVASVAAVLALALGWMIGRTTTGEADAVADDADDRSRRTTTTVAEPRETLPLVGEEIGGADFDDPETTEPPRSGPTTTEAEGPTIEPIAIDARLAGVPVRLVGIELGGVVVEADLARGALTRFEMDRMPSDGNSFVVGDDWVVATSNGQARVIGSDGVVTPIDLGDAWQILHLPGTDLFWRVPANGPSEDGFVLTLVDLDGEPVGPELTLPAYTWPYLVDPATGGVVANVVSRNYSFHPDGVEHLGTGAILGITPDLLVTYDCDATLVCGMFLIDRATGVVTPVPPDPSLDPDFQWSSPFGWGSGAAPAASPDGRWIAVIASSWRSNVTGIVELATGRFVELARDSYPPTVAWSPDGRFAFTLDAQRLTAYDTVTGDLFPVFTEPTNWTNIGVRPPVPPDDAVAGAGADGGTLLSASSQDAVEG